MRVHVPVLLEETIELLAPALRGGEGRWAGDSNLGLAGHAEAILERFPGVRLAGIDRDPEALELARKRLERFGERVHLVAGNFHRLRSLLAANQIVAPAALLADLGVSSLQLDRPERGFSFRHEGPLDMRMGPGGPSARDVVHEYPEAALERIIREYGEERMARRVARAIVARRREGPLETTAQLRDVIVRAKGGRVEAEGRVDPATRVFQALRIEVNDELSGLGACLDQAIELLDQEGRLVVISYHSLEDRIVKLTLRERERGEIDPVTGQARGETKLIEVLTRKPITPGPRELAANPRARSGKLRAARKL